MLLRSLLRRGAAAAATATAGTRSDPPAALASLLVATRSYAKAKGGGGGKPAGATTNRGKIKAKGPRGVASEEGGDFESSAGSGGAGDDIDEVFELATDPLPPTYDPALDVGPGGRPLFAFTDTFASFSHRDANAYVDFTLDEWKAMLPEGLPAGMMKEFQETRRCAVMVRESFLDLRDNFRRIVDPAIAAKRKDAKRQIVLDGPRSCGKSIALAMLVHWARTEGWLVFYVPQGKDWTHGGFFYRNTYNDLFDTPIQAAKILQDFLKYNETRLLELPCQIFEPIPLGEGAGVGMMKGADTVEMPEGSTLYDLIQTGITSSHASVGVVVRLRQELSLVKDVPVLFAIDQYNSWFTFSEFQEPVTVRSCRPIHAKELTMVNAYRPMVHNDMMVGAFSHSTAVGKLRQDLPDVPSDARVMFPRYTVDEAETVCHYYMRQKIIRRENFSEEKWKKIYYLSNGNGSEMSFTYIDCVRFDGCQEKEHHFRTRLPFSFLN
uniref:Small ribosomal subunit protein mS29 n=1 Tax=Leersia perrieri TaxID=77586 RepID=A0A0D9WWM8_9ORYZ